LSKNHSRVRSTPVELYHAGSAHALGEYVKYWVEWSDFGDIVISVTSDTVVQTVETVRLRIEELGS
jgi:hypothetical protein